MAVHRLPGGSNLNNNRWLADFGLYHRPEQTTPIGCGIFKGFKQDGCGSGAETLNVEFGGERLDQSHSNMPIDIGAPGHSAQRLRTGQVVNRRTELNRVYGKVSPIKWLYEHGGVGPRGTAPADG